MMRISARWAAAVVAAVALGTTAKAADIIGVNFTGGLRTLGAADSAGVVPSANYNNVIGGSGAGIVLNDDAGLATAALLTFTSGGNYDFHPTPNTASPGTNTLFRGGVYGAGIGNNPATDEVTITVTNVPYATYTVYIYAGGATFNNSTLSMSDGTTTYYYSSGGSNDNGGATDLLLVTSTDPNNPTAGPLTYAAFTFTDPSFTLTTGGAVTGVITNNVFGFQIVGQQAVPEPASLTLAAVGVAGLAARRRRRTA